MEGRHVVLLLVSAVVSLSPDCVCGSELKVTIRPGDNITLYCDCKTSTGVYIVWYKTCSRENQPSLVLKANMYLREESPPPNFHLLKNQSSESFDLLIQNITESDEGLYYCGTEEPKVEDKEHITSKDFYSYSNITTRIIFNAEPNATSCPKMPQDCNECWILLFCLCPVLSIVSSLLSSLVVYHCCKKAEEHPVDQQRPDTRGHPRQSQDDDVCYAAVEIRQKSKRPKKKKEPQTSDFCTYSAINASRM
ncbi:uncharacterized protein LOC132992070 isoform X2 [Labrus mixtus]|uniref:uncharacterized protein LOC132992070 isoform X2 n=1 Tax=Labrus mixtus TaxID=508554 RepID=UPI0029C06C71|nr:uncharacterized protein LOC132992070 isoform X2 [Labrus mixtus]